MILADATAVVAVPVWGLTVASGVVMGFFTLVVNLQNKRATESAAEKQKLEDDALKTHHAHDDERFDAFDRRLTGFHRETQDRFSKHAAEIQVAHTDIARLDERLAALKDSV